MIFKAIDDFSFNSILFLGITVSFILIIIISYYTSLCFQSCVPVDVMPGEFDPTNQFLPQQPLHRCMLPSAFSYSTVQSVTNPYEADVDGCR